MSCQANLDLTVYYCIVREDPPALSISTTERRPALGSTTNGKGRLSINDTRNTELETEKLRQSLCRMSSPELLRFGVITKCLCSMEVDLDHPPPVLLDEARKEWKKRHPNLPLSESLQPSANLDQQSST